MSENGPAPPLRSFKINQYIFAYVDILGQRQELAKIVTIPAQGSQEYVTFERLISRTIGIVESFRTLFRSFQIGAERGISRPAETATPEEVAQFELMKRSELRSHSFSDTLLLYCPLTQDTSRLPIVDVAKMLAAAAASQLMAITQGFFLRGGIDIGIGTELSQGDFYGPALLNAYRLEHEVADYPRILVGDAVLSYIEDSVSAKGDDQRGRAQRGVGRIARSLIAVDRDSRHFVDFLGIGFRKASASSLPPKVIKDVRAQTLVALEGFRHSGDSKLIPRYEALLDYIERSTIVWVGGADTGAETSGIQ